VGWLWISIAQDNLESHQNFSAYFNSSIFYTNLREKANRSHHHHGGQQHQWQTVPACYHQKTNKKPCHNPKEHQGITHQYVTPLRMTSRIPAKSSTKFALAANVKQVIHMMLYYDETLTFAAFDGISDSSTLYVKHDLFPNNEETFKEIFQVHSMTTKSR